MAWLQQRSCPLRAAGRRLKGGGRTSRPKTGRTEIYPSYHLKKKHVRQRPESLPENNDFSFHFQHFGLYISEQVKTARGSGVRYRCLLQWPLSQTKPDNQDPE